MKKKHIFLLLLIIKLIAFTSLKTSLAQSEINLEKSINGKLGSVLAADTLKKKKFFKILSQTIVRYNLIAGHKDSVYSYLLDRETKYDLAKKELSKELPDEIITPTLESEFIHRQKNFGYVASTTYPKGKAIDTLQSFVSSPDLKRHVLIKKKSYIISDGSGQVITELPLEDIHSSFCFAKTNNDLFVVDRYKQNTITILDKDGHKKGNPFLLDKLDSRYRIDYVLPEENLLIGRRINKNTTDIIIYDFKNKDKISSQSLTGSIATTTMVKDKKGGFTLFIFDAGSQTYNVRYMKELDLKASKEIGKQVTQFSVDEQNNKLIMLTKDQKLYVHVLDTPGSELAIFDSIGSFAIKSDMLVYWKQIKGSTTQKWELIMHNFNTQETVKSDKNSKDGFYYYTELRPEVPKIYIENNYVCYQDWFTNTISKVQINRLRSSN